MADGGADPAQLVRGHRGADARAAHENPALGAPDLDHVPELAGLVRVVDARRRGIGAEVEHLVSELAELGEQPLAELRPSVVERHGHLHGAKVTPPRSHRIAFPDHLDGKALLMTTTDAERWRELGQQLRVDSVRASAAASSGHPTSSMSAADLMAVLADRLPALRLRRARRIPATTT